MRIELFPDLAVTSLIRFEFGDQISTLVEFLFDGSVVCTACGLNPSSDLLDHFAFD
jgi:hypothetical protein